MAHPSKPILLHRCRNCGRDLAVERLHPPSLGLLPVLCGHCRHEHLFSPRELEIAQLQSEQMAKMPPAGIPRTIYDSLRRVLWA